MQRVSLPLIISMLILCLTSAGAMAALVRADLIGGLGEFEFSADTSWQIGDGDWPYGIKNATPDDSVAAGWARLTSGGMVPERDFVYRIVSGKGLKKSNCQYFAIKGGGPATRSAALRITMPVNDSLPRDVNHGDTLTFHIDSIAMSGSVPMGASVKYSLMMSCWMWTGPDYYATVSLPASQTSYSAEVTATVPSGARDITLRLEMKVTGNLGSSTPGVYVDGARLYRRQRGSSAYEMEEVPAPVNRSVKSQAIFFRWHVDDPYEIASDYDAVMLQYEQEYPVALRLKYYHPDIDVFLYEFAGGVTDWRDQNMVDAVYSNSPIQFGSVLAEHIDWLYPWPNGFVPAADNREPWLRNVMYLYDLSNQNCYLARMADSSYQQEWRENAASKALAYRLDGVFIDGAVEYSTPDLPMERLPWEVQSFEHSVYPYLRQRGLQIVQNSAIGVLSDAPASIYYDPCWKPTRPYTTSAGYDKNTPQNTPDTFFQEWAFLKHYAVDGVDGNRYDLNYWNDTLDNMDAILQWNKSLSSSVKKSMFALVDGIDRPQDPAYGIDGWVHFGFCSFLLTQHQYASIGAWVLPGARVDLSSELALSAKLGDATSGRGMLATDMSLQMRLYKNGLVLVNGHPTQSRSYRLYIPLVCEDGTKYQCGQSITLKPHTGRILFYK